MQKFGIFVTVYIFNTDVSKLMQQQSRTIEAYRERNKTLFKVSFFFFLNYLKLS